jgi:excisionase family DNA binding protein
MSNMLSVKQAAVTLNVSRIFLHRLVKERRVPHFRIEREIRFDETELREFFKAIPKTNG